MFTWNDFVAYVANAKLEFPHLRVMLIAQAGLESGFGTSQLFLKHGNPWGMHYHPFMASFAHGVNYDACDGSGVYAEFVTPADALTAYWAWFDHWPHYEGWRDYAKKSVTDFLSFIIPHYCPPGMTDAWKSKHDGWNYVGYVTHVLYDRASKLVEDATEAPKSGVATWCRVYALTPDVGLEACDDESRTCAVWRGTNVGEALTFLKQHPSLETFRCAGFTPWPGPPWDGTGKPAPRPPELAGKRVALDVGHGYTTQSYDPGCNGPMGEHEYKLNEQQAKACADYLRERGAEVSIFDYDEPSDAIGLEARGRRGKGYDAMVSLHLNASDKKVEYSAAFCHPMASAFSLYLGSLIAEECSKVHNTRNVGAKQWAAYSILIGMEAVKVPGCISEACFLDSPGEKWPEDAIKYGEAIGRGIERFLKGEKKI